MKTRTKAIVASIICIAFSGAAQAALVAEWNFDSQTFANSGTSGATHDGTFVTTNANYFSTDTFDGTGYSLWIQSISDESVTPGGDVLLINNSSMDDAGYVSTFDGAAFTVSMWVKSLDTAWTEWDEIAGKQIENYKSSPNDGWSVRSRNGNMMRFDSYGAGTAESTSDALDQTWHLVTATYDGATMSLYVDGVLEASTESVITDASLYSLAFGARDDGSRGENILLDEIQYYDEALSALEVYQLFSTEDVLFVSEIDLDLGLLFPATTVTGSVAVSYASDTSVDVAVSFSDESHAGAFSLLNTTPMVLTDPIPSNTVLEFVFDNAAAGLQDGESATGLVTIAWNVTGDTEVTEIVLPISVLYEDPAPGPILWDIGNPSDGGNIPSTAADFVAAGVTQNISGATVSNVEGAQNMAAAGITVDLSNYAGTYSPSATYTGAGASIMKEYVYHKGVCTITIGGLSSRLDPSTEYSLYVWGKGDATDQTSIFTFEGTEITTATNDVFTSDATNFLAKYSFTTDTTVSNSLSIEWAGGTTYKAFNGFAIVAVNNTNPGEVGAISINVAADGTEAVLSFDTTSGHFYGVAATSGLPGGWSNVITNIPGNGGTVTVTNTVSAGPVFYRAYLQD